jgi:hypothetical protein
MLTEFGSMMWKYQKCQLMTLPCFWTAYKAVRSYYPTKKIVSHRATDKLHSRDLYIPRVPPPPRKIRETFVYCNHLENLTFRNHTNVYQYSIPSYLFFLFFASLFFPSLQDIEQLLNYIGAESLGPRHVLANLKQLTTIIQSQGYISDG